MSFFQELDYVDGVVPSNVVSKTLLKRCIQTWCWIIDPKSKEDGKKIFGKLALGIRIVFSFFYSSLIFRHIYRYYEKWGCHATVEEIDLSYRWSNCNSKHTLDEWNFFFGYACWHPVCFARWVGYSSYPFKWRGWCFARQRENDRIFWIECCVTIELWFWCGGWNKYAS